MCRLLRKDVWKEVRKSQHGVYRENQEDNGYRYVVTPVKRKDLPKSLPNRILGSRQSGMGRSGLQEMIDKYGLS